MNGPISGTPISSLNTREDYNQYDNIRAMTDNKYNMDNIRLQQDMQNQQYGSMQNLQFELAHNAANTIQQAQHNPYYALNNDRNEYYDGTDMEDLAKDISKNLPNEPISEVVSENIDSSETETETGIISKYFSFIPQVLIEPILLVLIFIILSQPVVKQNIGNYIKQINPDATGKVSQIGIVIYGIILAVLFSLTTKFLL